MQADNQMEIRQSSQQLNTLSPSFLYYPLLLKKAGRATTASMFVLLYIYNFKIKSYNQLFYSPQLHLPFPTSPNNSPPTISQTTSAKLAARVGCNSRREKAFGNEKKRDGIGHCAVVFRRRV
jgi:hypothetical protein